MEISHSGGEEQVLWELRCSRELYPWMESPGAAGGLIDEDAAQHLPFVYIQLAPNIPAQAFVTAPGSSFLQGPVSEPISSFSLRQLFTFLFV